MGSDKQLKVLAGVLVLLLGVIVLRDYLAERWAPTAQDTFVSAVGDVSADSVTSVSLTKDEETLQFEKMDGAWEVDGWQADSEALGELLVGITEPESVQLVAETDKRHEGLGVASGSAQLTFDGAELILGNRVNDGFYVRLRDDARVFEVEPLPASANSTALEDWVDTVVTKIDRTAISSVLIEWQGRELALAQQDGEWYLAGSETPLDTGAFDGMLMNLESLAATGIVTEEERDAYSQTPALNVTVEHGENSTLLTFFQGEEESVMVANNAREGEAFEVSTSILESFQLSEEDLEEKEVESGEE